MSVKDKNMMDGMVIQLFLHEKSLLLFIYKVPSRCGGFHKYSEK